MKTSTLELGNLIQGFKLTCQTEGKSPKTVEWYTSFLERFRRYLKVNDYPYVTDQIDKTHIRAFIRYLQTEASTPHGNKPLSPATVQGYVRTLKAFFAWLTREEYIKDNPMKKIPVLKAPVKVIVTFGLHPYDWTDRVRRVRRGNPLFSCTSTNSSKSFGER